MWIRTRRVRVQKFWIRRALMRTIEKVSLLRKSNLIQLDS
jgi:hypothetical protein